jgi:hypothetical protein
MNTTTNEPNKDQDLPQWKKDQRAISTKVKVIQSNSYNPLRKPLSRRDKHRLSVASSKH